FHFDHGGNETGEGRLQANAASDTFAERLAPTGFLRGQIEHRLEARTFVEHGFAEFDRILVEFLRDLVDEAFDRKHIDVRTDAPPETRWHCRRLDAHVLHFEVLKLVRHVDRAIDR